MLKFKHNRVIKCLIVISSTCLFLSCKNNSAHGETAENIITVPEDEIEFQNEISNRLEHYLSALPSSKKDSLHYADWRVALIETYKKNEYKSFWTSKEVFSLKGKEMFDFLSKAEFLGLNKELYQFKTLKELADSLKNLQPNVNYNLANQLETGLTRAFLQMSLHLDKGMFANSNDGLNSNFWNSTEKYFALLEKIKTQSVSGVLSDLEPKNPMYKRYMEALRQFVEKNNISSNPIQIRDPKLDSLGSVSDARVALVYHHYLEDSLKTNEAAYQSALKKFQQENNLTGDGIVGVNTIKALERDNAKKFQLLAINADRWRQEHIIELPEKYVWVNLPSYKLKIIEQDTLRLEKNVVIGKSNLKNETPTLESGINQIVLWPTWTVPQSIVKNEMKSFKGYLVTKKGNWTSVVQPPGYNNALGSVKILFPNKYSVYIHDTPAKRLFGSDFRAASHGCVRCQDPLEVAANLMMMDTFQLTYDSLIALKERKIETKIFHLKNPIPVYFRYFTAEADLNGNMKYYADVYGKDKDMINFIFNGKQPHVLTAEERAQKIYADSVAQVKKRKSDSIEAALKIKKEQEKIISSNSINYSPKADTTSVRHDSL